MKFYVVSHFVSPCSFLEKLYIHTEYDKAQSPVKKFTGKQAIHYEVSLGTDHN